MKSGTGTLPVNSSGEDRPYFFFRAGHGQDAHATRMSNANFGPYFVHFRDMRRDLTGLPAWARFIFIAVALPGIALVALSILLVVVSVVALLVIAIPTYAFLRALTRIGRKRETGLVVQINDPRPNQTIHVDAIVRDADASAPDEVNGE